VQNVLRKAEEEQKKAEDKVTLWTRLNYVVWFLGWLIAQISKLGGAETVEA
jgi:hypothetical protein